MYRIFQIALRSGTERKMENFSGGNGRWEQTNFQLKGKTLKDF